MTIRKITGATSSVVVSATTTRTGIVKATAVQQSGIGSLRNLSSILIPKATNEITSSIKRIIYDPDGQGARYLREYLGIPDFTRLLINKQQSDSANILEEILLRVFRGRSEIDTVSLVDQIIVAIISGQFRVFDDFITAADSIVIGRFKDFVDQISAEDSRLNLFIDKSFADIAGVEDLMGVYDGITYNTIISKQDSTDLLDVVTRIFTVIRSGEGFADSIAQDDALQFLAGLSLRDVATNLDRIQTITDYRRSNSDDVVLTSRSTILFDAVKADTVSEFDARALFMIKQLADSTLMLDQAAISDGVQYDGTKILRDSIGIDSAKQLLISKPISDALTVSEDSINYAIKSLADSIIGLEHLNFFTELVKTEFSEAADRNLLSVIKPLTHDILVDDLQYKLILNKPRSDFISVSDFDSRYFNKSQADQIDAFESRFFDVQKTADTDTVDVLQRKFLFVDKPINNSTAVPVDLRTILYIIKGLADSVGVAEDQTTLSDGFVVRNLINKVDTVLIEEYFARRFNVIRGVRDGFRETVSPISEPSKQFFLPAKVGVYVDPNVAGYELLPQEYDKVYVGLGDNNEFSTLFIDLGRFEDVPAEDFFYRRIEVYRTFTPEVTVGRPEGLRVSGDDQERIGLQHNLLAKAGVDYTIEGYLQVGRAFRDPVIDSNMLLENYDANVVPPYNRSYNPTWYSLVPLTSRTNYDTASWYVSSSVTAADLDRIQAFDAIAFTKGQFRRFLEDTTITDPINLGIFKPIINTVTAESITTKFINKGIIDTKTFYRQNDADAALLNELFYTGTDIDPTITPISGSTTYIDQYNWYSIVPLTNRGARFGYGTDNGLGVEALDRFGWLYLKPLSDDTTIIDQFSFGDNFIYDLLLDLSVNPDYQIKYYYNRNIDTHTLQGAAGTPITDGGNGLYGAGAGGALGFPLNYNTSPGGVNSTGVPIWYDTSTGTYYGPGGGAGGDTFNLPSPPSITTAGRVADTARGAGGSVYTGPGAALAVISYSGNSILFTGNGNSSWTVPAGVANIDIEVIGSGGVASFASAGGGGGFAGSYNVSVTSGSIIYVYTTSVAFTNNTSSWINVSGANAAPTSDERGVLAYNVYGVFGSTGVYGQVKYTGGDAGESLTTLHGAPAAGYYHLGGGAGGAAGPDGPGGNGAQPQNFAVAIGYAGGGGGANGGTAGIEDTGVGGNPGIFPDYNQPILFPNRLILGSSEDRRSADLEPIPFVVLKNALAGLGADRTVSGTTVTAADTDRILIGQQYGGDRFSGDPLENLSYVMTMEARAGVDFTITGSYDIGWLYRDAVFDANRIVEIHNATNKLNSYNPTWYSDIPLTSRYGISDLSTSTTITARDIDRVIAFDKINFLLAQLRNLLEVQSIADLISLGPDLGKQSTVVALSSEPTKFINKGIIDTKTYYRQNDADAALLNELFYTGTATDPQLVPIAGSTDYIDPYNWYSIVPLTDRGARFAYGTNNGLGVEALDHRQYWFSKVFDQDSTTIIDQFTFGDQFTYDFIALEYETLLIGSGEDRRSADLEHAEFIVLKTALTGLGADRTVSGTTVTAADTDRLFVGQQYGDVRLAGDPLENLSYVMKLDARAGVDFTITGSYDIGWLYRDAVFDANRIVEIHNATNKLNSYNPTWYSDIPLTSRYGISDYETSTTITARDIDRVIAFDKINFLLAQLRNLFDGQNIEDLISVGPNKVIFDALTLDNAAPTMFVNKGINDTKSYYRQNDTDAALLNELFYNTEVLVDPQLVPIEGGTTYKSAANWYSEVPLLNHGASFAYGTNNGLGVDMLDELRTAIAKGWSVFDYITVGYTPIPTTSPAVYKTPAVAGWSDFMNAYGVWVDATFTSANARLVHTRYRVVDVPATNLYPIQAQADNAVNVYVDDVLYIAIPNIVGAPASAYTSSFTNITSVYVGLTAGPHVIKIEVTNDIPEDTWNNNPAGYAVRILKPNANPITQDPNYVLWDSYTSRAAETSTLFPYSTEKLGRYSDALENVSFVHKLTAKRGLGTYAVTTIDNSLGWTTGAALTAEMAINKTWYQLAPYYDTLDHVIDTDADTDIVRIGTLLGSGKRASGDARENVSVQFLLSAKAGAASTVSGLTTLAKEPDRLFVGQLWGDIRQSGDPLEQISFTHKLEAKTGSRTVAQTARKTNWLSYSERLDKNYWSTSGATVTTSTAIITPGLRYRNTILDADQIYTLFYNKSNNYFGKMWYALTPRANNAAFTSNGIAVLTQSSSVGQHYISATHSRNTSIDNYFSFSTHVEVQSGVENIRLDFSDDSGIPRFADFNLVTGAMTTSVNIYMGRIFAADTSNGWYVCQIMGPVLGTPDTTYLRTRVITDTTTPTDVISLLIDSSASAAGDMMLLSGFLDLTIYSGTEDLMT